ncbi:MAG TPA: membrane dipeptidase [bacterium]|nr:membrane dipeptidase [bacterium]
MSLLADLRYQPPTPSYRALRLHRETPVADLHCDTLSAHVLFGFDALRRHTPWVPFSPFVNQCDLPRIQDGGIGIWGLGLIASPVHNREKKMRQAQAQLDYLERLEAERPQMLFRIRDKRSLAENLAAGRVGTLPGVEGAHIVSGDLGQLQRLIDRGLRYFGLTHFSSNEAASCAHGLGESATRGLTPFGRKLIETCEQHRVLIDLAHINKPGFMEACAMLQTPPIVSHTGVTATHKLWRNIDDEQLEAVAKLGGVVGIMASPKYLTGSNIAPLTAMADAIEHVRRVAGIEHVALGSDMDGWLLTMPRGLRDASDWPHLTEILIERGWSDDELRAFLGLNVRRVLDAVLPEN